MGWEHCTTRQLTPKREPQVGRGLFGVHLHCTNSSLQLSIFKIYQIFNISYFLNLTHLLRKNLFLPKCPKITQKFTPNCKTWRELALLETWTRCWQKGHVKGCQNRLRVTSPYPTFTWLLNIAESWFWGLEQAPYFGGLLHSGFINSHKFFCHFRGRVYGTTLGHGCSWAIIFFNWAKHAPDSKSYSSEDCEVDNHLEKSIFAGLVNDGKSIADFSPSCQFQVGPSDITQNGLIRISTVS